MLSKSLEDTKKVARDFLLSLKSHPKGATVVGLSGDLGSGKTTFTKCLAEALGIGETVTSPTFVIEKIYKIKHPSFSKLIHVDAYRLEGARELAVLGWSELLEDPENLIVIEWPENVSGAIPASAKTVSFTFVDENTRKIEIKND